MKVQALIPTMHREDHSVVDRMNIQTDAIVVNQCDRFEKEVFNKDGHTVEYYSLPERGIGLSRNFSLMRATGDIVLFADDDIVYYDNYEQDLIRAFEENPDADMIAFNLDFKGSVRKRKIITKVERVRWYNCGKYGAARIAVKLESIRKCNICFSLLFGGGAKYSAGEDSLFINDAIKAGMRMYAVPITVAEIEDSTSTWFSGHNEKYFFDKGVYFAAVGKRTAWLRCVSYALRYPKVCREQMTVGKALKIMLRGRKEFG